MLTVNNLTGFYDKNTILKDISFKINNNEIVSITGKNGSGKTTIIRYISTLMTPKKGDINLDGVKYNKRNLKQLRKNISVLIDGERSLYENLTVNQNIKYFLKIFNMNYMILNNKIKDLIYRFELTEYKDELVSKLSKGNRQKVSILIAIIKESKLLILDEPDNALDAESIKTLIGILKEEKLHRSILLVSHDKYLINSISDTILHISESSIKEVLNYD